MSNRKSTKWSEAEITAANAEQMLAGLAESLAAEPPGIRGPLLEVWDRLDELGRAGEFEVVADGIRADSARQVLTDRLAADMVVAGCPADLVALMRERCAGLGDDFWAGIYETLAGV